MKSNTFVRIILFVVALPLLAVTAFAWPRHDLPLYALLVIAAAAVAAREAAFFFPAETRSYPGHAILIPLTGSLIPAIGYSIERFVGPRFASEGVVAATLLIATVVMTLQVGRRVDKRFTEIVPIVGMHLFLVIYPGLFAWYAVRIAFLPQASWLVLAFVLSVYLNDSAAWLFGRLLGWIGRRPDDEPPVAVSPNKSWIGFLAGFLTSPLVLWTFTILLRPIHHLPTIPVVILGFIVGATAILGDLVESALKRSAAMKDSGRIVPGRGGLLDSIDSPLFTAPFFYYGVVILSVV